MPLKVDNRPPNQMRHGPGVSRGAVADVVADLDDSLEESHRRMRYALAVQTRRIEQAAQGGGLTTQQLEELAALSNTWRTLTVNQPAPDLKDLTDEQLKAKLEAVKARGK